MTERESTILALYQQGLNHRDIGRQLGISGARVGQILAGLGHKDLTQEKVDARREREQTIQRMRDEGKTLAEIGEALGITTSRIWQILARIEKRK